MEGGNAIYSGAYIMASGKSSFGYDKKHQNHLHLLNLMLNNNAPDKIQNASSLESIFNILKSYPTFGNFLSYQFSIDLNYSSKINFSEMDFVVPGPGAKDGIRKCFTSFGDYSEEDIIKFVTDLQVEEFNWT